MSEKTYSKEDVVKMLTTLFKELTEFYSNTSCSFDWETEGEVMDEIKSSNSMYSCIYGQIMNVIEASVDKHKIEPTKSLIRQLLQSTQIETTSKQNHWFKCLIENKESNGGYSYRKLNRILNS